MKKLYTFFLFFFKAFTLLGFLRLILCLGCTLLSLTCLSLSRQSGFFCSYLASSASSSARFCAAKPSSSARFLSSLGFSYRLSRRARSAASAAALASASARSRAIRRSISLRLTRRSNMMPAASSGATLSPN